jgi:hypothetical protein
VASTAVHVHIDEPRSEDAAGEVDCLSARGSGDAGGDLRDATFFDEDVRELEAAFGSEYTRTC